MAAKTMSGARAKIFLVDPTTNQATIVGIWSSISYHVTLNVSSVYILGRFSAAELVTTSYEPVSIQAQGWRSVGFGPYVAGRFTNLKNLLTQEYLLMQVYDRQTNQFVASIRGCLPTGFSVDYSSKQLSTLPCSYIGLLVDDESEVQEEAADAANYPI